MADHLSPTDIAEILIRLQATNPDDANDLRNHLEQLAQNGVDHLVRVAIDPVWRTATELAATAIKIEQQRIDLENRKLEAYKARTQLLQDSILPKAIPVILLLSLGMTWIMIVALANFFDVDWRDLPLTGL